MTGTQVQMVLPGCAEGGRPRRRSPPSGRGSVLRSFPVRRSSILWYRMCSASLSGGLDVTGKGREHDDMRVTYLGTVYYVTTEAQLMALLLYLRPNAA